ncbi:single-stranded-DNA-specific exonuclease RecJ [Caloranaerobacter azorensis]|uniref:Single-stranded-DNA-specific exonuclease RecJ n=1 Tax=Caloranaerobacter azorensis TaxID=116090 RepID=A0A6P1YBR1_9FIRM|nr:single-stranded-DNA-specific exonuclease RecJ [Caloranaerobacter azorensis]QIB26534.1 single-stranded-DNA-specific exonuclease RecJ [Caloranaerobacter azorensis]
MIRYDKFIKLYNEDYSNVNEISSAFGISSITAKVLINRGIKTVEECKNFINVSLENLYNPFLLKDMDVAVERIINAIQKNEQIWIYGDYDVDGITSTTILKLYLQKIGCNVNYYIPDRMTEGYGVNKDAIDYIVDKGGQLIITVDCGITAIDEVKYCNEKGIEIIITDHHLCKEEIPNALAVINPNRKDSDYPFKKLAGVGVAFKLIQAISNKLNIEIPIREILPIVAIGTVADVVSLTGENRILVKEGLALINQTENIGVKALLEVTGLKDKDITVGHVGFVIGPRINAAGRLGSAKTGVELLTCKSKEKALSLAVELDRINRERQEIEMQILKEAEEIIKNDSRYEKEKVLVIAKENWHHGVIGIVASRICEKYFKPCILIAIEGNQGRGSARSIPTFDIYEGLSRVSEFFNKFGGHKQAAGLSINTEKIEDFRKGINEIAEELLMEEDMIDEIKVDDVLKIKDIDYKIIDELKLLKPYGIGNPSPLFISKDVKLINIKAVGSEGKHLKFSIEDEENVVDCIGFNLGYKMQYIKEGDRVDIVFLPDVNIYMNETKIQLNIKDIFIRNKISNDIEEKYYLDFIYNLKEKRNNTISNPDNKIIIKKVDDRIRYLIGFLHNNDNTLVIINNLLNAKRVINELYFQGREFNKRISINIGDEFKIRTNTLLISPLYRGYDLSVFDKIIFFDICFDEIDFFDIIKKLIYKEVYLLFDEEDFKMNQVLLNDFIPKLIELRIIYKTFLLNKKNVFKIDIESYFNYLNKNFKIKINRSKFIFILEVLKDSNLIEYKIVQNDYYIKLKQKPKDNIEILEIPVYKSANFLLDNQKRMKNTFLNLFELKKEEMLWI